MKDVDLLGRPLDELDGQLLDVYRKLKLLAARVDAPPCVNANVRQALAVMWQVVNDLNLEHEQLDQLGV